MFRDILGQAWEAMVYNRRRTAITMIGMAWGIATVVLLVAYGSRVQPNAIEAPSSPNLEPTPSSSGAAAPANRRAAIKQVVDKGPLYAG